MVAFLNSDCTFTLLQNLQGFMCVRVCVCLRLTWILLSMLGLKMYMPALILLETKT